MVGEILDKKLNVLAISEVKSRGIKRGVIVDANEILGSLKEAIELGFELMFQSDLNPAVIAACKDLDELDIYLDCLDDNELEELW